MDSGIVNIDFSNLFKQFSKKNSRILSRDFSKLI